MNWSSPELVSALLNAATGIVGALLGAGVAYWAARNQYATEYLYKKWDALRAVQLELCHNQDALFLDLDRSLPAWLVRAHRGNDALKRKIGDYVAQSRRYQVLVYEALFADLITTKFASELATYYRRLAWLNEWVSKNFSAEQGADHSADRLAEIEHAFDSYMLALANCILLADDLVPAITAECRKLPIRRWGRNQDLETFEDARQRHRFGAELAKLDLAAIEAYLAENKRPSYFPDVLAASDRRLFGPYVEAARQFGR